VTDRNWINSRETDTYTYDPGLGNTAACKSSITYLDGDAGVLLYRGYPIEEVASQLSYMEAAYLVLFGEVPNSEQLSTFEKDTSNAVGNLNVDFYSTLVGLFSNSHPMLFLHAAVQTLPISDGGFLENAPLFIGALPVLSAMHARTAAGLEPVAWRLDLPFTERLFHARFGFESTTLSTALDLLLLLHADHEQNCSTTAARVIASSQADPRHVVGGALGALAGPLHGGANEEVLVQLQEMLEHGGSTEEILSEAKSGTRRLMGFGHRVYKNFDPRATLIRKAAHDVFEELGITDPLLEIATNLEKAALADDYFVSRKLYPNVDFYSGLIYRALGFSNNEFTPLFGIGRCPGWLAHANEQRSDAEQRIIRPQQIYVGPAVRSL